MRTLAPTTETVVAGRWGRLRGLRQRVSAPGTARLLLLYLRSRLVGWALLGLALVTLLTLLLVLWRRSEPSALVTYLLVAIVPVLTASIVASTVTAPWGEIERCVSWPLARVRTAQVGVLTLLAGLGLALVCIRWPLEMAGWVVLRNVGGACGLALLTAALLGGRLAWLGPMLAGALLLGLELDAALRWIWPLTTWRECTAMLLPPLALLIGLLFITLRQVPLQAVQNDAA